jgi:hypothetical protein
VSDPVQLQDRIQSRRTLAALSVPEDDPDACDDWGSFGMLRGSKERALMLDLRMKNGQREAFAYALLERVSYDPSEGLTLRFLGTVVKLVGRHLTQPTNQGVHLVEALHRHRVVWIAELDEVQNWVSARDVAIITEIVIDGQK